MVAASNAARAPAHWIPVRIISSFRDYYDSAVGHDDVAVPVYVRETGTVGVRAPGGRGGRYWQDDDDPEAAEAARALDAEVTRLLDVEQDGLFEPVTPVLLGFCGALAWGWRLDGTCRWTAPALLDALEARPMDYHGSRKHFLEELRWHRKAPHGLVASPPRPFDLGHRRPGIVTVFRVLDAPCFLLEPGNWWGTQVTIVRNPPLGPLGFARVLDPYSARQAVETFLSNELARQVDPMDDIGDDDLRDMKGFDGRSFRADPGGPTRKRKKGKRGSSG